MSVHFADSKNSLRLSSTSPVPIPLSVSAAAYVGRDGRFHGAIPIDAPAAPRGIPCLCKYLSARAWKMDRSKKRSCTRVIMVNDIWMITKDENAVIPLPPLLLLLLLSLLSSLLSASFASPDICEFVGGGVAEPNACGANRRTVNAHIVAVPPKNMSSNTMRKMESAETPPTDIRLLHDFLLVDDDVVVVLFCVVFAGVVGEVFEAVEVGSSLRSAGCLGGNGEEGVELVDNCRISGDLGAVYPISPTLEGNGSASGRASGVAVGNQRRDCGEVRKDIRVSVEVEEDADDIIQSYSLSK
jgi:hypothetical protein